MMYIRIFFFGLIAIAKAGNYATVILPQDSNHLPYVAFDQGTCQGCGIINVNQQNVWGYSLIPTDKVRGYLIDVAPITATASPGLIWQPPTKVGANLIPASPGEAAGTAWIAPMAPIAEVGSHDGKVDATCVDPSMTCSHQKLAALMNLKLGTLQTCHLVENAFNVYAFDFKVKPDDKIFYSQAVASVVGLVYTTTPQPVQFMLTSFSSGTPGDIAKATLTPSACVDQESAQCIDIFVGNLWWGEDETNEVRGSLVDEHFKDFQTLLATTATPAYTAYSELGINGVPSQDASKIQPSCRQDLPGVPSVVLGKSVIDKGRKTLVQVPRQSPYSRPICPLTVLEAP